MAVTLTIFIGTFFPDWRLHNNGVVTQRASEPQQIAGETMQTGGGLTRSE